MLTKNKKIIIVIIAILLVALIVTICRRSQGDEQLISEEKFSYALSLNFEFRIIFLGDVFNSSTLVRDSISPASNIFDPSFTELVFVHNEAEAADFPAHIIAAWPRESNVEGIVWGINQAANRDENDLSNIGVRRSAVSLEDFGLSYPVTAEDLVDNWEKVNALWHMLLPDEHDGIRWIGILGIPAAHINE